MFPEFDNRDLFSLLHEYLYLVDPHDRERVARLVTRIVNWSDLFRDSMSDDWLRKYATTQPLGPKLAVIESSNLTQAAEAVDEWTEWMRDH